MPNETKTYRPKNYGGASPTRLVLRTQFIERKWYDQGEPSDDDGQLEGSSMLHSKEMYEEHGY